MILSEGKLIKAENTPLKTGSRTPLKVPGFIVLNANEETEKSCTLEENFSHQDGMLFRYAYKCAVCSKYAVFINGITSWFQVS